MSNVSGHNIDNLVSSSIGDGQSRINDNSGNPSSQKDRSNNDSNVNIDTNKDSKEDAPLHASWDNLASSSSAPLPIQPPPLHDATRQQLKGQEPRQHQHRNSLADSVATTTDPSVDENILDNIKDEEGYNFDGYNDDDDDDDDNLDDNDDDKNNDDDFGSLVKMPSNDNDRVDPHGEKAVLDNEEDTTNNNSDGSSSGVMVSKEEVPKLSPFGLRLSKSAKYKVIAIDAAASEDIKNDEVVIKSDPPDVEALSSSSSEEESSEKLESKDPNMEKIHVDNCAMKSKPNSRLPLICLRSGLKKKVSVLRLQSWISLALTLDGRDKITKVMQYAARMLAWWYTGRPRAQRFEALKASLVTSRKAFRLGRSLMEVQKLRSMGLLETIGWHLQQACKEYKTSETNATSSLSTCVGSRQRYLLQSLNSLLFTIYRPIASTLSYSGQACKKPSEPMWQLVGSALKMVGLFGFWTGDNVAFLAQSGFLDDLTLTEKSRAIKRKNLQTRASIFANRCYFGGSLAGLLVALRSYHNHRQFVLQTLLRDVEDCNNNDDDADTKQKLVVAVEKAKCLQFTLFLAVLKGVCDVLVFSNNPGLDLWSKHAGRKLHEGLHCAMGLVSASTVLYNNFPDASK